MKLRYKQPSSETSRLFSQAVLDPGPGVRGSEGFRFSAAVAGFGMLLRDSEHRGSLTLAEVIRLAERSRGSDPEGYRAEFVRLARLFGGMERSGEAEEEDR